MCIYISVIHRRWCVGYVHLFKYKRISVQSPIIFFFARRGVLIFKAVKSLRRRNESRQQPGLSVCVYICIICLWKVYHTQWRVRTNLQSLHIRATERYIFLLHAYRVIRAPADESIKDKSISSSLEHRKSRATRWEEGQRRAYQNRKIVEKKKNSQRGWRIEK